MLSQFSKLLDHCFGISLGVDGVSKLRRSWKFVAREYLPLGASDSVIVIAAANTQPGYQVRFG